ncbi:MAG: hypothetical protein ABEJ98_02895 [Candidatus Nanohaloarchaea archaeon]
MTEKELLEEQLRELSEELGEELFRRMKKLQQQQLDVDLEEMDETQQRAEVAKSAYKVDESEDYRRLAEIAGKVDEARLLLGDGVGADEPDEDFVEEPRKVEDEEAVRQLRTTLEDMDFDRVLELDEEVEELEEELEEFSSKAE